MELEQPTKFFRLGELRKRMLSECSLCHHTGIVEGKACRCFKTFERYVQYSYAGVDEEYWPLEFKDFESDQVARELAETYSLNLANARKFGLGFVFSGRNGTGKTMLCCVILKKALKEGHTIYFITFADLLDIIKKSFDNEYYKALFEKIRSVDFLCLDELGAEYRPKDLESFCVAQLSQLSRSRRRNHLCTLVTTNLEKPEFETVYGKTINSLFSGCSKFVSVKGEDWRRQQNISWEKNLLGKSE